MDIRARLKELNLVLPPTPQAVAEYVPAVQSGSHVYVSGQLPLREGNMLAEGRVPDEVTLEQAQAATRQCVLNGLAAADGVLEGDWSRFVGVVRVAVYVNSSPHFALAHKVANGGSELIGQIFGESGQHARAAVGVANLPLNAPVEMELLLEVV